MRNSSPDSKIFYFLLDFSIPIAALFFLGFLAWPLIDEYWQHRKSMATLDTLEKTKHDTYK